MIRFDFSEKSSSVILFQPRVQRAMLSHEPAVRPPRLSAIMPSLLLPLIRRFHATAAADGCFA
jgi:hypothetical protein